LHLSYLTIFSLAPFGLLVGAGASLFFERKLIAIAQKRLGISFTGRQGWAILPSDVFKFLTKTLSRHNASSNFGLLGLLGSLFVWSLLILLFFIPNTCSRFDVWDSNLFFFLVYANLSTIMLTSLVMTTRSKFSSLAALRASLLAPLMELYFVSVLNLLLIRVGSLSLEAYGRLGLSNLVAYPALGLILFIFAFYEAKRPPFDHTEAESELVVGHLTEFGGRTLLLFFLCEYVHVFVCLLVLAVFSIGFVTVPFSLYCLLASLLT